MNGPQRPYDQDGEFDWDEHEMAFMPRVPREPIPETPSGCAFQIGRAIAFGIVGLILFAAVTLFKVVFTWLWGVWS